MRTRLIFLAMAALALAGCASLLAPGPDRVPVYSDPPGAFVKLDGVQVGRTPCILPVDHRSEGVFVIELEGYRPVTVDRDKVCNGLTALNLLGGFVTMPLFFGIDALTGNLGKYSTEPIRVHLLPIEPPPPPPAPTSIARSRLRRP